MYGRAYVWLIMGSYSHLWWNHTDTDCNINEMERALESVIVAELLPLSTSGDITVSGIVSNDHSFLFIEDFLLKISVMCEFFDQK